MLLIVIIIIIYILFYLLNKYFFKKERHEHFLTFFLPFYDKNLNTLSNFYYNKEENLNFFKKKFVYEAILFSTTNSDKNFIAKLMSFHISTNNTNNIKIIVDDDIIKKIYDLIDNKINFLITDYATIVYINNILKKDISSIRLVTNTYRLYFYFFTKKRYNVFSLNDIPPSFVIGIIEYPNPFYLYFYKLMTDLGFNVKTDFKIKKYKNLEKLLNGFDKSECHMIMFNEVFPNKTINNYLNLNTFEDIILIPFDIEEEDLFLKKNKSLVIDYIDLNKLSVNYLPKNFANYTYNVNKPDFKICYNNKLIIANVKNDEKFTYDFIKFYYYNFKIVNKSIEDNEGYLLYKTLLSISSDIIDFHIGVLKFLKEIGYISNNNHFNCKYLVGTMECTDENLAKNNLYIKE